MAKCRICKKESKLIASHLGACLDCIREDFNKCFSFIQEVHSKSRQEFNLPLTPGRNPNGISCDLCINECKISEREFGFCGLRKNVEARLIGPNAKEANLSWYFDPLKNTPLPVKRGQKL